MSTVHRGNPEYSQSWPQYLVPKFGLGKVIGTDDKLQEGDKARHWSHPPANSDQLKRIITLRISSSLPNQN